MQIEIILFVFTFILVVLASIFDLKSREVPDTLSYILIIGVSGMSLIYSLYSGKYIFFVYSMLGLTVFFLLGYILYFTKQMGGGDVKILAALGASMANNTLWDFPLLLYFFLALACIGAIYTLVWSLVLYFKSFHDANKKAKELLQARKSFRISLIFIALLIFVLLFFSTDAMTRVLLAVIALLLIFTFYLYIFLKVVESLHFVKKIPVSELTEGDWLAKDVERNNKIICSAKHPCLDKKQIESLKKAKVEHVIIKVGIPFVPAILIATLVTYVLFFLF